jgi:hypothetical protein
MITRPTVRGTIRLRRFTLPSADGLTFRVSDKKQGW